MSKIFGIQHRSASSSRQADAARAAARAFLCPLRRMPCARLPPKCVMLRKECDGRGYVLDYSVFLLPSIKKSVYFPFQQFHSQSHFLNRSYLSCTRSTVVRDSRTQGEPRALLRSGHFRTTVWLWSRVLHTVASIPAIRAVFRRQYAKMRIRFISWPKQIFICRWQPEYPRCCRSRQ